MATTTRIGVVTKAALAQREMLATLVKVSRSWEKEGFRNGVNAVVHAMIQPASQSAILLSPSSFSGILPPRFEFEMQVN